MLKVLLFIVLAVPAISAESAEGEGKLIKPKEIISECRIASLEMLPG
jgi:hypothetical protein